MKVSISNLDTAPEGLYSFQPFEAALLKQIPGKDRPDYWLAKLDSPINGQPEAGGKPVTHLVLAARFAGKHITPTATEVAVNIAYVIDQSLLNDSFLNFGKCRYVAIGHCTVVKNKGDLWQRLFG